MSRCVWMCGMLAAMLLAGCEVGVESGPTTGADAGAARTVGNATPPSIAPSRDSGRASTALSTAHGNLPFVKGYQTGYDRALTAGKPMLVFFTAEWCHFCHQMEDEAFTNPQVVGLADRFVCIVVDADAEPDVCRKFRVQGYPTVQFLSPRGVPLNRLVGKKPSHQVMMAMQAALQNVARRSEAKDTKSR